MARNTLGGKRSSILVEQEEKRPDLGFGTRFNHTNTRLVNKDGSFNVRRTHGSLWARLNLFHRLIVLPWSHFLLLILISFLVANLLFALIYQLIGTEFLLGIQASSASERFWEAYFFSAQTLTTVGYGRISPVGFMASSVAALESLIGVMSFALATGLFYAKFSRPTPRIRFSRSAVFAPYLDVNALMFRIINERSNQLIDLEVDVTMSRLLREPGGKLSRQYSVLPLERRKVAFFPTNWTIVHPVTADSPLYQCTPESLAESDAEFLIMLRGIDDTFSQMVHVRYSYRYDEILWGYKFRPMFDQGASPQVVLDLHKLDDTEPAPLN